MKQDDMRYAFGENWQSFVNARLDATRVDKAIDSLKRMLKVESLRGQSFLDIGCGSGMYSLAALLMQAERTVSFDYDPNSVEASMVVRARADLFTARWQILQGSILDSEFFDRIEPADVVYAWGVLHHTGKMWNAIDRAVSKVKPGGLFAIAIYNDRKGPLGSAKWWHIKQFYNRSPKAAKCLLEIVYAMALIAIDMLTCRNPLRTIRAYRGGDARGMDFWHDVRDWLGGFPYEYATVQAINDYVVSKFGLHSVYLKQSSGNGCNEFTFRRL